MWSRAGRRLLQPRGAALGAALAGAAAVGGKEGEAARPRLALRTWGSNQFGQLAAPCNASSNAADQFEPQDVGQAAGLAVAKVACFGEATVLLTEGGRVMAAGRSAHGSLGQGEEYSNVTTPAPLRELDGKGVHTVSVGEFHLACVDSSGGLWTAGRNWSGEIGRDGDPYRAALVESESKFRTVACGRGFTAAVDVEGRLHTFGSGRQGALGHGTLEDKARPAPVDAAVLGGRKVVSVACGQECLLVLTEDGTVFSCGNRDYGKLGRSAADRADSTLAPVAGLSKERIAAVACGDYHCAAVTEDGKLFTWGAGGQGQLGHNAKRDLEAPLQVHALADTKVASVACGGAHTLAVLEDGSVFAWGRGRSGQLGVGSELESVAAERTAPNEVRSIRGCKVVQVAAGRDHSACLALS